MNLLKLSLDVAARFLESVNKCMPGQLVDVARNRDFDPLKMREEGWEFIRFTDDHLPRTAASLGVGQRDAEWLAADGVRWRWASASGFPSQWWSSRDGGFYMPSRDTYIRESRGGPFTAIWTGDAMTWLGWAVPAILTVLDEHFPQQCPSGFDCNPGTEDCPLRPDEAAWREHVAPLIAKAIGCDPKRAADVLSRYRPDKVHI